MKKIIAYFIIFSVSFLIFNCVKDSTDITADSINENLLNISWDYDTKEIRILPKNTGNNYIILSDALEAGKTYTFSAKALSILYGNLSDVTMLLYDKNNRRIYDKVLLKTGGNVQYTFSVPEKSGLYELIIYAGIMGNTMDNSLSISQAKLELGRVATKWTEVLFNNENLLPGKSKYDPSSFIIKKSDTNKNNNMRLYTDLQHGGFYKFSFSNIEVIEGTTEYVSVIIFDNTNKVICYREDFKPGSSGTWFFTVPPNDGPEYQFIIYTGIPKSATGISIKVSNAILAMVGNSQ
ncbi:hypothetical protein [Sediminispirochaeta bajacaliforniensis]|uniref:hypothetical protein n=1 Tax=Sediminispirochaeta bajacaliforniensis TaxID=148 RepID=UPI0012B59B60|nr:hypothetical protein [Sediminispirochaeta bajacaliforniensis]